MDYEISEMRTKVEDLAEKIGSGCKIVERLQDDYFGGWSYDIITNSANIELNGKKVTCITLNSYCGWRLFFANEKIIVPEAISSEDLELLLK